jgi:Ca-activated chloride channel family protein
MMDERHEGRPTAYVLGEMSPEEREGFEAEMKESAELRAEVEEIREMAALLERELAAPKEELPADMRARIEAAAQAKTEEADAGPPDAVAPGGSPGAQAAGEKAAEAGGKVVPLAPRRPLWRRASVWLAAAAVMAAAPALFLMSGRSDEKEMAMNAAPAASMAPAATAPATVGWNAPTQGQQVVTKPGKAGIRGERAKAEESPASGSKAKTRTATKGVGRDGLNADGDVEVPAARDRFDEITENPFLQPSKDPLSTFSIDVDTASYALVRTHLQGGSLPPAGAVRIEEMVNYFGYDYAAPEGDRPFRVALDLGVAPWAPSHKLVRVGLKGKDVKMSEMDGVNLVFLVDTSGSMSEANKLPLLKQGFRMLVDRLRPNDRVAIVAYAGSAGLVLPSTPVSERDVVLGALERLSSGGSTNGGAGIQLAYDVAAKNFLKGGVNRVLLATDGDFNVGVTGNDALVSLIQEKAKTGVFLSVLGFGRGNFNDSLLEKVADKGNGQYAYIDDEKEAKRVLVEGLGGLVTIAKDVKLQVEWNPATVAGYRLIGYENRTMAAQDFHDDRKDAGELGSGHTVTALYEVIPAGGAVPADGELKYQKPAATGAPKGDVAPGELLTVKLRYKDPDASESQLMEVVLKDRAVSAAEMSGDFKLAAAVASFGMLLRGSKHAGNATFDSVLALAEGAAGDDEKRRELVELVRKAKALSAAPR